jgi:hypothetical protein
MMKNTIGKTIFKLDKFLDQQNDKEFKKEVMNMIYKITLDNQNLRIDLERIKSTILNAIERGVI